MPASNRNMGQVTLAQHANVLQTTLLTLKHRRQVQTPVYHISTRVPRVRTPLQHTTTNKLDLFTKMMKGNMLHIGSGVPEIKQGVNVRVLNEQATAFGASVLG